jgi:hypothetical protein
MQTAAIAVFIPILVSLGAFAMVFGIRYLQNKENVAMIEKGMNPKLIEKRPTPYRNLKWGLLIMGAGVGLFAAYLLDNFVFYKIHNNFDNDANVAIYFALIAIGGGVGLISSYRIEKRELLDKQDKE